MIRLESFLLIHCKLFLINVFLFTGSIIREYLQWYHISFVKSCSFFSVQFTDEQSQLKIRQLSRLKCSVINTSNENKVVAWVMESHWLKVFNLYPSFFSQINQFP